MYTPTIKNEKTIILHIPLYFYYFSVFALIMGLNISIKVDDEATAKPLTKTSSWPTASKTAGQPICKYGDGCYRENPEHLDDYHQGKTLEERRKPQCPCPYGSKCYRTNPKHLKQYHS